MPFEETRSVEVSFDKSIDSDLMGKSNLVKKIERWGDKWKLYTDNPDKLVKNLAKFAEDQKLIIVSIQICAVSLEDTFIKLTEATL